MALDVGCFNGELSSPHWSQQAPVCPRDQEKLEGGGGALWVWLRGKKVSTQAWGLDLEWGKAAGAGRVQTQGPEQEWGGRRGNGRTGPLMHPA